MKLLKLACLVGFVFSSIFSSCKKDDDVPVSTVPSTAAVATAVTSNTSTSGWRVTLYNENGVVKTSSFNGYNFNFASNGTMTAVYSSQSANGTWSTFADSGKTKLDLTFNSANSNLQSINDDWEVLTATSNKIELRDISGGNGTTDLLTLER